MPFLEFVCCDGALACQADSWEDAAEPSQSDSPPDRWDESFSLEPDI